MSTNIRAELRSLTARIAALESPTAGPAAPVLDSLLTEQQLAERLGHHDREGNVSTRKLEDWRTKGIGPNYIRPRGTRSPYYRLADVDTWLLGAERTSTVEEVR